MVIMKLNLGVLNNISYIYLAIPLLLFLMTYLNLPIGILAVAALLMILTVNLKKKSLLSFEIPKKVLFITVLVSFVWVYLSGIGGTFYQNSDFHLRNALLRDLINYASPVTYDNGSVLVYYMGFILPAAYFGKLMILLGAGADLAFKLASIFNALWCVVGLCLVSIQLFLKIKVSGWQFYVILLTLIFFSGLDVLHIKTQVSMLEWWAFPIQYSSNTTLLFWVFNQTITTWLIVLLFLQKPFDIKNYAYWGILCFFYAPMPFVGLSLYFVGLAFYNLIKCIRLNKVLIFFRRVFSTQNVLSLIVLFPIIYFYYKSNAMVSHSALTFRGMNADFFLTEAGFYLFVLLAKNYKNPLYIITFVSLFVFPFVQFGGTPDLCMRGSIPALFTLMFLILQFLFDKEASKILKTLLVCLLIAGSVTPLLEFQRGIYATFHKGEEDYFKDRIGTLNNRIKQPCKDERTGVNDKVENWANYCNYGSINPKATIFFKYFGKNR